MDVAPGGARRRHARRARASFESTDRLAGWLLRLGRESLAARVEAHLRELKACAEGATGKDATG